jgi:pheophorbide a oxygenase
MYAMHMTNNAAGSVGFARGAPLLRCVKRKSAKAPWRKGPTCVRDQQSYGNKQTYSKAGTQRGNVLPAPNVRGTVDHLPRQFHWSAAWYPVAPISFLEGRAREPAPTPMVILGHRLVIWCNPKTGAWCAMEDICPHRLAPLSEGRIDTQHGHLQCAYHGWTFDSRGQCVSIPQSDKRALAPPRACVTSYPTTIMHGLLWVWMEPETSGRNVNSESTPLALPDELRANKKGVLLGDWYMRDLPISWEYLVENLLDPGHVHFSHHGVIGSRNKAGPIPLRKVPRQETAGGFTLDFVGDERMPRKSHFLPPSLCWLDFEVPGNRHASMLFYAIPVSRGRSRIIAGYSTDALPSVAARLLSALSPLTDALSFASHLAAHEVLDGDTILLRGQEERMRAQGSVHWRDAYVIAAQADAGVVAFRDWLEKEAGGEPAYHGIDDMPTRLPEMGRREMLDRFEQHTKDCPQCRRALARVRIARSALTTATTGSFASAFALILMQAGLPQSPLRGGAAAALCASGLSCAVLNSCLSRLENSFVFTDYVHSNK